jgi:haloacetate dehalogenase
MFEGFVDETVSVGEVDLRVRHAGVGPPVLLIHGHPRTGSTWHRVAPLLLEAGFRVICPDMRGYGSSGKPAIRTDHSQQSKRVVAQDLLSVMNQLGHRRFAVAGHDRGSYVALRLALDHPAAVRRLVVMDGVPISDALSRCTAEFAQQWYHWFFFAQADKPERAIAADPDAWYPGDPAAMGEENHREFLAATRDAATVRAMLEDYRAGLGIDRVHEQEDRDAGRTVQCPALLLWSTRDDLERLHGDPVAVWQPWVTEIRGVPIDSAHHMAEENPVAVARALRAFLN